MDEYTTLAKALFDQRFSEIDSEGVYVPHQPIYGFRQGHTEPFAVNKYVRSYQILKSLSRLRFSSMLDVGGAEGYKAGLISSILGAKCLNSNLSPVACKRSVQLLGIPSVSSDIGNLPFADEEFDAVLCSETLEHVADPDRAIEELIRIARNAVVITVPHDPDSVVRTGKERQSPLGHIHAFDEQSFDHLKVKGYRVVRKRMLNWATMILGAVVEATPIERSYLSGLPHSRLVRITAELFASVYNLSVPTMKLLFGRNSAARVIEIDEWFCRLFPTYSALIFVIIKDQSTWVDDPNLEIRARQVLDFSVPRNSPDTEGRIEPMSDPEAIRA